MRTWILSLAVLAISVTAAEGKCRKRRLNFKNRDHYSFTADGSKGKAIKALKGSGQILKGRNGQTINLEFWYAYGGCPENRCQSFKGKVCFEMQGASEIYMFGGGPHQCAIGCPEKQWNKDLEEGKEQRSIYEKPTPCPVLWCGAGPLYNDMIEIEEKKRGSYKKYCVKAPWNTSLQLELIADEDQRVQVQNLFVEACEVTSKYYLYNRGD